ncbi:crossover junction endonuclease MUS81 isoform X2 [Ziziphus jujuba]|uniref:Crossover junction endonuclease MUS81 n=1 Tax=Ziziphus jujuba TaxID=326968 RepID=A0ABM3IK52_ZIZJJ|nr:crossover junction endonuclease MUS81 isoform X2 [Ziziphus jujuba]
MERQRRVVVCAENEELAAYMLKKWDEMANQRPKGITENVEMTLTKAYSNLCASKTPIQTLKEFSQIKGVGKWILRLMQGFFETVSGNSEPEDLAKKKGKKTKGARRYMPQKNSVAYALLITLYRGTTNGNEFMRKQELIDAAEASGLSRVPIAPEKGKGKPSQFGSSPREWYSGWSCMKTLITKGLVVKSSCPAKYMLTQEGKEAARECQMRSGLPDTSENAADSEGSSDLQLVNLESDDEATTSSVDLNRQKPTDIPPECIERFMRMGYPRERILQAFSEIADPSKRNISSLWPSVLCRLREDEVYGCHSKSQSAREDFHTTSTTLETTTKSSLDYQKNGQVTGSSHEAAQAAKFSSADSVPKPFTMRACSSSVQRSSSNDKEAGLSVLSMPPLAFGERFEDVYEVILILDDREQFATQGSRCRRIIENIRSQFKIQIQVRRLPVGDGIWIARHKYLYTEYVLDFIVERKNIDDLRCSIRDNRYKDQKLRLLRCGLKKLIYLVEGDPNSSEAAESIKTACFTTEVLEGFDVQRTSGLSDTLKKYGYLTQAITQYYKSQIPEERCKDTGICPPFDEFIKRCQDLDKMTVSDVFAIQLMQVPQVTEEIAIAVLDIYPTLLSLAHAYSRLDGDVAAQEDMLRKQSRNAINGVASRNIFQLVWGN